MVAQVKTWHDATRSELIVTVLSAVDLEPRVGGQYRSARKIFIFTGRTADLVEFWGKLSIFERMRVCVLGDVWGSGGPHE